MHPNSNKSCFAALTRPTPPAPGTELAIDDGVLVNFNTIGVVAGKTSQRTQSAH